MKLMLEFAVSGILYTLDTNKHIFDYGKSEHVKHKQNSKFSSL